MGYKTKIQKIKRLDSHQWYVNFPRAVAAMMEFEQGEEFEWTIKDKRTLVLIRCKK